MTVLELGVVKKSLKILTLFSSIFRLSEDLFYSMLTIEFVSSNVDCSWNISDSTLSLLTSLFGLVLKDFFACLVLSIIGLVIF